MANKQNANSTIINRSKLFSNPDKFSLKEKKSLKDKLCHQANITKGKNHILIAFELNSSDTHTQYLFEEIIDGLSQLPINVVVLGKKKDYLENYNNIKYLSHTKTNINLVRQGADVMVLPQSYNIEDECLKNGTTCIFHSSKMYAGNLVDFNPISETGNAFACKKQTSWMLFASIVRVIESYKFSYDWSTICKNAFATGQGV